MLGNIGDLTFESTQKIDNLIDILNNTMAEFDSSANEINQPPLVYFLGGTICGSFFAVILVIYLNKNKASAS